MRLTSTTRCRISPTRIRIPLTPGSARSSRSPSSRRTECGRFPGIRTCEMRCVTGRRSPAPRASRSANTFNSLARAVFRSSTPRIMTSCARSWHLGSRAGASRSTDRSSVKPPGGSSTDSRAGRGSTLGRSSPSACRSSRSFRFSVSRMPTTTGLRLRGWKCSGVRPVRRVRLLPPPRCARSSLTTSSTRYAGVVSKA